MNEPRLHDPSLDALVQGWRFWRVEVSSGVYEVGGNDAFGRRLVRVGTDAAVLLDQVASDARHIAAQLRS
jgi:hypothetical protein